MNFSKIYKNILKIIINIVTGKPIYFFPEE